MGQSAWTIKTSRGKQYNIGLYHGEESGHLVVHTNNAITLIDFGIKESKDYKFFIEEDLCELKILKSGASYTYDFKLDREADTPLNRRRKSNERTEKKLVLRGVLGVILGVILMLSFSNFSKAPDPETRAEFIEELSKSRGYPQTEVRIYETEYSEHLLYSYKVGTQIFKGTIGEEHPPVFPLEAGDAFELRYLYDQPDIFYIDYTRPKQETLLRLTQLTFDAHAALHPELTKVQVKCQIELAYHLHQFAGLAEIYFQQKEEQWTHPFNKNAYLRLVRSPEFSQEAQHCL